MSSSLVPTQNSGPFLILLLLPCTPPTLTILHSININPAPASCKRDRSKSVADKALGSDNLRHGLKPPGKCTRCVQPTPSPPTPAPAQSKNPSAVLFLGQRLPTHLKDHLLGRMCLIRHALGELNSSTYCLAAKLTTFLLEHPTHHSLVLFTEFP